jgi:hypothetical protein
MRRHLAREIDCEAGVSLRFEHNPVKGGMSIRDRFHRLFLSEKGSIGTTATSLADCQSDTREDN